MLSGIAIKMCSFGVDFKMCMHNNWQISIPVVATVYITKFIKSVVQEFEH